MSAVFKLVHLSDLHFAVKPNRLPSPVQTGGLRALFEAAVSGHRGNWFRPASHATRAARAVARYMETTVIPVEAPDAVIVSGDLAATGSDEDLRSAHGYLLAPTVGSWVNRDQEPRLSIGDARLVVMPGNHDRYHQGTLFPGAEIFEEVFSGSWNTCGECDRVSSPQLIAKDGEVLSLICADFTFRTFTDALSSLTGYIGQGTVYSDVLRALVSQTLAVKQLAGQEVAVVWVLHYPPGYPNVDSNLALLNEAELLAAAKEVGVKLILAGHTHIDHVYSIDGVTVSCVGSATQADADAAWHFSLNELTIENGVISTGQVHPFRYVKANRNNFVRGDAVCIQC